MTRAVSIPIIDLSTFFLDEELDQVEGKKKVAEKLKQACSELGLCQVVNHGVPINLINQALDLCKEFFDFPSEEKLKLYTELDDSFPLLHGYHKHNADKHETLFMHPPGTNDNVIPTNPPKFKFVIEELYTKFTETCQLLEGVLNDSLGLPPNFLKNYNNDRSEDCLFSYHYFPATESENNVVSAHQDPSVLGLIYQDDAGGLKVLKDGEWIPVAPIEGALVFHICDVLQVLTNNKLVSPRHRVVRSMGKNRYSFVFFYNLKGEKWVEPLPHFTEQIGERPKYRNFQYKDYCAVRVKETFSPADPAMHDDKKNHINQIFLCDLLNFYLGVPGK